MRRMLVTRDCPAVKLLVNEATCSSMPRFSAHAVPRSPSSSRNSNVATFTSEVSACSIRRTEASSQQTVCGVPGMMTTVPGSSGSPDSSMVKLASPPAWPTSGNICASAASSCAKSTETSHWLSIWLTVVAGPMSSAGRTPVWPSMATVIPPASRSFSSNTYSPATSSLRPAATSANGTSTVLSPFAAAFRMASARAARSGACPGLEGATTKVEPSCSIPASIGSRRLIETLAISSRSRSRVACVGWPASVTSTSAGSISNHRSSPLSTTTFETSTAAMSLLADASWSPNKPHPASTRLPMSAHRAKRKLRRWFTTASAADVRSRAVRRSRPRHNRSSARSPKPWLGV